MAGADIPPLELDPVGVLRGDQALFKALGGKGDRGSAGDRIEAIPVAELVGLDHPLQVVVHQHEAEVQAGLKLRSGALIGLVRAFVHLDHPLASDGARVAALVLDQPFTDRKTPDRLCEGVEISLAPVLAGYAPVLGARNHADGGAVLTPGLGQTRILDLQPGLVNGILEPLGIRYGNVLGSANDDGFQFLGAHDSAQPAPSGEIALFTGHGGKLHLVLARRPYGEEPDTAFDPFSLPRLHQIFGFIDIFAPEMGGVSEFYLVVIDPEIDRAGRLALHDDPIVSGKLQLGPKVSAAVRLSPELGKR